MDVVKTMDLTRLCIRINHTVVFPNIHTLPVNLIRNSKPNLINSKTKVHQAYGVMPCFVSHGFGHCRKDRIGQ